MTAVRSPEDFQLIAKPPNPNGERGAALFVLPYPGPDSAQFSTPILPRDFPLNPCCPDKPFHLRIYHINDLHGQLSRFTAKGELAVLSRMVWKVKQNRLEWSSKTDQRVLFLSSGDNWDGSIYDDLLTSSNNKEQMPSYYSLFSTMGLDACGIGNHEFSPGLDCLLQSIREKADFPVFAANLSVPQKTQLPIYPAGVLVLDGLRVGLIGVTTRAEILLDPNSASILNPFSNLNALISILRPICDVLIILSHLGYDLEDSPIPMADAGDVQLAASLPEGSVDLIVGGHSHTVLNQEHFQSENLINGIPIVQAGANGEYLGQVDLQIFRGTVRLKAARLWQVCQLDVDQDYEKAFLDPVESQAHSLRDQVLGSVGVDLWRQEESISAGFSRGEEALANFLADALVKRLAFHGYPVDFAMLDSSALQSGLPENDILTYGDCFELMPYLDRIVIYSLTVPELRDLLNDNACRFRLAGEDPQEKGFLQFSEQLRYRLNRGESLTDAYADNIRINSITLQNLGNRTLKIGSTSFTRAAACSWEKQLDPRSSSCLFNLGDCSWQDTGLIFRREMISYISEQGGITKESGARKDGRVVVNPPWEDR